MVCQLGVEAVWPLLVGCCGLTVACGMSHAKARSWASRLEASL